MLTISELTRLSDDLRRQGGETHWIVLDKAVNYVLNGNLIRFIRTDYREYVFFAQRVSSLVSLFVGPRF